MLRVDVQLPHTPVLLRLTCAHHVPCGRCRPKLYAGPRHEYDIIVCHMNVIRYFVLRALQLPPEAWLRLGGFNGSITHLTIRPSGRHARASDTIPRTAMASPTPHTPPREVTEGLLQPILG